MAVFINNKGVFEKLNNEVASKSINDISLHLGYNTDQICSYFGENEKKSSIEAVLLEVFTTNVVAVLTQENIDNLSTKAIDKFLESFSIDHEFSSYNTQAILLDGIENKSFDIDFLSKTLEFEPSDINGEYYSQKIDTYLFFINGKLASFKFGDELNKWARHIRSINQEIIASYAKEAKHFWGDNYDKIFDEINLQADAFASTPDAFGNEYVKNHITDFDNIDFVMLLVCHYDHRISLSEFKQINHGRYNYLGLINDRYTYSKGKFQYEFNNQGILIKAIIK